MTIREKTEINQTLSKQQSIAEIKRSLLLTSVIGLFIGFLAPFGMNLLPLVYSMGYWWLVCLLGYLVFAPCVQIGSVKIAPYVQSNSLRLILPLLLASCVFTLVLTVLNGWLFSSSLSKGEQFINLLPAVLVIGGGLTLINMAKVKYLRMQRQQDMQQQTIQQHSDAKLAQLLKQLPIEKRGQLLCLEMDDHYLKVHTDKGCHMLLMRFKDALHLVEDVAGLQTHRSWWVALDAVNSSDKEGRKLVLTLCNGLNVPVSKTYGDQVKQALFI